MTITHYVCIRCERRVGSETTHDNNHPPVAFNVPTLCNDCNTEGCLACSDSERYDDHIHLNHEREFRHIFQDEREGVSA